MSYKKHIHNTKMKMVTRNNLLKKLSNSKWGCNARTIRTTALALSYSAAEYACPVWARSPHASKLDPELNDACRSITRCLRPTNVEELYLLAGIAPPDIRRDVCTRVEKKKQNTNAAHSLHGQVPAERRLKRECFLSSVRPADFPAKVIRCSEWKHRHNLAQHNSAVNLDDSLEKGHTSHWAAWRCLNMLRTGIACSKEKCKRWKYFSGDTSCECGRAPEATRHMLQCSLLAHPCTLDDLRKFNGKCRRVCGQMEECGLMTRKKKKLISGQNYLTLHPTHVVDVVVVVYPHHHACLEVSFHTLK